MNRLFLSLLAVLFIVNSADTFSQSQKGDPGLISDGPYFFFEENQVRAKWIQGNILRDYLIDRDNYDEVRKTFNLKFSFQDLQAVKIITPSYAQKFKPADSLAIITDIHGEYNSYISLLKSQGIIDNDLNWKFGKGHLVIMGDVFDRGDKVTEVFWHLFGIEKQAEKAGGMVHFLLGNHEIMNLSGDNDYMNPKYAKIESLIGTNYINLYSDQSVLGKWLRTKPVAITIGDILFVHAGLSAEMAERKMKVKAINTLFLNYIVGKDPQEFYGNKKLKFLDSDDGPVWYRGYFTDSTFCENRLDSILNYYAVKHIVVGHTPHEKIFSLYNNKIFGADSGIVLKLPGELLIYKNGYFYKGLPSGKRIRF